jgi:serine/threonine protein phosphatase PrpC
VSPSSDVVVLRGDDHHDYDRIEVAVVGEGVAVGLSRGRHPKRYTYTDPNEDVVAALTTDDGVFLVIADGHNGYEASDLAVAATLGHLRIDTGAAPTRDRLIDLLDDVNQQVLRAVRAPAMSHSESRTTLVVAHLGNDRLTFAAMGDSAIYLVRASGSERLDAPRNDRFVGYAMSRADVAAAASFGCVAYDEGDLVVLATDGFCDFSPDVGATLEAARRAPALSSAMRACIVSALDGGAGDNVAVAMCRPRE